jgi:hypothetical protein
MGPIGCPEVSVQNHHPTLHNIALKPGPHLHRGRSLKTRTFHLSHINEKLRRELALNVVRFLKHVSFMDLFKKPNESTT